MILREGREGWSQGKVASASIFGNHCSVIGDVIKENVFCVRTVWRQKKVKKEPLKKEEIPL